MHLGLYFLFKFIFLPVKDSLVDAHSPVPLGDVRVADVTAQPPVDDNIELIRHIMEFVHLLVRQKFLESQRVSQFFEILVA